MSESEKKYTEQELVDAVSHERHFVTLARRAQIEAQMEVKELKKENRRLDFIVEFFNDYYPDAIRHCLNSKVYKQAIKKEGEQ